MGLFAWQDKQKGTSKGPTVRERLTATYGKDEADRRIGLSEQSRQRKQLREYKRRTARTSRKLTRETGELYSATPPVPGRTWGLMDILEIFRVMQYPIFNAAREIGAGGDVGQIMQSALEGITLKQRSQGDDVLEAFGVKKGKGRSLAGFGMDLLLDPMNFVGGPLGMTKLGKLSKMKKAGALDNLMEGSRLAKSVLGMFPGDDLATALSKVPDLAETFAGQAAKGQRALLTWRGNTLANNQAAMEALEPAYDTVMAWAPVKYLSKWFVGTQNKTVKKIADAARWYHRHMDENYRQEGAELLAFINEGGDAVAKTLVQLNEDPTMISWATIIMADKGHFPNVAQTRVDRVRKVAQKVLKRQGLTGEKRDLIKSTLRLGFTEGDVDMLIDTLEDAIGPAMSKELNMDNPAIRTILKGKGPSGGGPDELLFNPYMMEELYKIIDPDEEMRGVLGRVLTGQGGSLSPGILQRKVGGHKVKGKPYRKPYALPNFVYEPGPKPLRGDFSSPADFAKATQEWEMGKIDTPLFAVHKRHKVAKGSTIEGKRYSRRTGKTHPGPVHVSVNNVIDYHIDTGSEIVVVPLQDILNTNPGKLYGGTASDLMFSTGLDLPDSARTFTNAEDARKYLREVTGWHGPFAGAEHMGLPDVNMGTGWTNADSYIQVPESAVNEAFEAYINKHVSKYLIGIDSFGNTPLQGRAMSVRGQLADFMETEITLRAEIDNIKIEMDGTLARWYSSSKATSIADTARRVEMYNMYTEKLVEAKTKLQNFQAMNKRWKDAMMEQGYDIGGLVQEALGGTEFRNQMEAANQAATDIWQNPAFNAYFEQADDLTRGRISSAIEGASTAQNPEDIMMAFQKLDSITFQEYVKNYQMLSAAIDMGDDMLVRRMQAKHDEFVKMFEPLVTALEEGNNLGLIAMEADTATTTVSRALAESLPPEFFTPAVEETIEAAANAWQKQPEATKEVFRGAVKLIHKLKNAPGPLGVLVENGIHEAHIFGFMLHEYARDPATVLAQSPEMFFLFNSLARFGGDDVAAAIPRINTKLLDRADGIHMAQSAIEHLKVWIHPAGVEPLSSDGQYFLHLMGEHLTRMRLGEKTRGPYSALFAASTGRTVKNKRQVKGLIGMMRGNAKRMASAVETGSKEMLRSLRDGGFITATMVDEIPKLTQADRIILAGRFMDLYQVTGGLARGDWDEWVTGVTRSYLSGKAFENAVKTYLTMGASSQGFLGVRSAPKGSEIVDILDTLRSTAGYTIDDKVYEIAGKMRGHFKQMRDIEVSVGILQSTINNYFPHILSEEAMDDRYWAVATDGGGGGGQFSRRLFASKHRSHLDTLEKLNADEIAETAHKLFIDNPALAYTIRGAASARAVSYQQMVTEIAKEFGTKHKVGEMLEQGKGLLHIRGLGDIVVDEDIVRYVDGFKKLVTNQSELKEAANAWNQMLSWWKGWTLGVFPSYHARNLVSNLSQNYMSGMPLDQMLHYHVMARRIQKYGPSLTDEFVTFADGTRHSLAEIWQMGQMRAVSGSGMYMTETPEFAMRGAKYHEKIGRAPIEGGFGIFDKKAVGGARKELAATLASVPTKKGLGHVRQWIPLAGRKDSKLLATGFMVGRAIENNARWAQFLFSNVSGHTWDESRLRVAKYLFDYDDISIGVQQLKKIFPFITWSRKNIPLQLEHLIMQPSKVARFAKLKDYVENNVDTGDVDFPDLPQFIRENVPLSWRKLPDGTFQYFLLGNWLAMADVDRIFSPTDGIMNMLFPGIRIPFELGANYSFFYKTQIDRGLPGEKRKFLGMNLSPKTAHVLRSMRVLNETNRLFGLGDEENASVTEKMLRSALGLRLAPVDLEQEQLKRHRDYADKLGRKLADERYKRKR